MNILVCLKQILDPEISPRDFRVDAEKLEARRGSAGLVMNIFCGNALETALQFRERAGGRITALSFGEETAEEVLRKALALRVDNAVLVTEDSPSDKEQKSRRAEPVMVARVLAAAARKLGDFDLILVGREAGDWGEGQTGGLLAEELGWPCISFAEHLERSASNPKALQVRRQTEYGVEVLEAASPLVVTVTNHEHNVPRIPKTRDVMMAYRQPLTRWSLAELAVEPSLGSTVAAEVVALTIPHKESRCEFADGETLEERVTVFAERIMSVMRSA
jgi:electron transfer flavoprotein beta subunit